MHRCKGITAAAAALCAAALLLGPRPALAQSLSDLVKAVDRRGEALFGSTEFQSQSFKGLPQWQRVLQRMTQEGAALRRCAADAEACETSAQRSWRTLIQEAKGLPRGEMLHKVNQFFNRWPYKFDQELYGLSEYWASPSEFMTRSGDCEDYAIAKFFALRHLGFDNDSMRVVILWDQIRGIGHAVLAIYEDDRILILDNLSRMIIADDRYKHYIPQYSMNETTRWAHVHSEKIPSLFAKRN